MSYQWRNKRFKSMSSPTHFPMNNTTSSTMHTNCTPVLQDQARDDGRRYKKLCVESDWRQGGGAHTVEQGSSWHRLAPHQGIAQAWTVEANHGAGGVEEGLLTEW